MHRVDFVAQYLFQSSWVTSGSQRAFTKAWGHVAWTMCQGVRAKYVWLSLKVLPNRVDWIYWGRGNRREGKQELTQLFMGVQIRYIRRHSLVSVQGTFWLKWGTWTLKGILRTQGKKMSRDLTMDGVGVWRPVWARDIYLETNSRLMNGSGQGRSPSWGE